MPFLENVLRGRNVPRERLLQVAHHYEMFGGVSPINQQNRNLIAALKRSWKRMGQRFRSTGAIATGIRCWLTRLRQMASDGIKNALAFVTSAYSSYSSCRQYLQNISDAQAKLDQRAPRVEKLRAFYNHPLFIEANVDRFAQRCRSSTMRSAHLVFTAHSIPESMAANCDYAAQLAKHGV